MKKSCQERKKIKTKINLIRTSLTIVSVFDLILSSPTINKNKALAFIEITLFNIYGLFLSICRNLVIIGDATVKFSIFNYSHLFPKPNTVKPV